MGVDVLYLPTVHLGGGFTQSQFRKLDQIYCRAASAKIFMHRMVECDFDEGVSSYMYAGTCVSAPSLKFVIRKVGNRVMMYELYKQGKGRIAKSGLFERAFDALEQEVDSLLGIVH